MWEGSGREAAPYPDYACQEHIGYFSGGIIGIMKHLLLHLMTIWFVFTSQIVWGQSYKSLDNSISRCISSNWLNSLAQYTNYSNHKTMLYPQLQKYKIPQWLESAQFTLNTVTNLNSSLTPLKMTASFVDVNGSGSSGQLAFWTGTSTISGDDALKWDNSQKRLKISSASGGVHHGLGSIETREANKYAAITGQVDYSTVFQLIFDMEDAGSSRKKAIAFSSGGTLDANRLMTIRANGNVGIGTKEPLERLELTGALRISNTSYENEGTIRYNGTHFQGRTGVGWVDFGTAGGAAGGWSLTGNSGTTAGTNFLGTTDNESIELHVNSGRALRLEPTVGGVSNIIGGWRHNYVASSITGAFIGGGGDSGMLNRIKGDFGTVGGGRNNEAGKFAVVCGGKDNYAQFEGGFVGAGSSNEAIGLFSSIIGGRSNRTEGVDATIGGGNGNMAKGQSASILGGSYNEATGASATVAGGGKNRARGNAAVVAGGFYNNSDGDYSFTTGHSASATGDYSFAAGRRARARHDGTFVWADSEDDDFESTKENQFLIRASGGVGIATNEPTATLDVKGSNGFNQLRLRSSYTPTGTGDINGNVGDLAWDEDYVYVKTTKGWKRTPLSSW